MVEKRIVASALALVGCYCAQAWGEPAIKFSDSEQHQAVDIYCADVGLAYYLGSVRDYFFLGKCKQLEFRVSTGSTSSTKALVLEQVQWLIDQRNDDPRIKLSKPNCDGGGRRTVIPVIDSVTGQQPVADATVDSDSSIVDISFPIYRLVVANGADPGCLRPVTEVSTRPYLPIKWKGRITSDPIGAEILAVEKGFFWNSPKTIGVTMADVALFFRDTSDANVLTLKKQGYVNSNIEVSPNTDSYISVKMTPEPRAGNADSPAQ